MQSLEGDKNGCDQISQHSNDPLHTLQDLCPISEKAPCTKKAMAVEVDITNNVVA